MKRHWQPVFWRQQLKKRLSTFLRKKSHPVDLAGGFSDFKVTCLLYCTGAHYYNCSYFYYLFVIIWFSYDVCLLWWQRLGYLVFTFIYWVLRTIINVSFLFVFIFAYLIDLAQKGELTHIVNELLIICNMHRYADLKMMKFKLVWLTFGDDVIRWPSVTLKVMLKRCAGSTFISVGLYRS